MPVAFNDNAQLNHIVPAPVKNLNFFLQPPVSQNPNGSGPGTLQGVVFNDLNGNHVQDADESGVAGMTVFLDEGAGAHAHNGVLDADEVSTVTSSTGGFFFSNVAPGL